MYVIDASASSAIYVSSGICGAATTGGTAGTITILKHEYVGSACMLQFYFIPNNTVTGTTIGVGPFSSIVGEDVIVLGAQVEYAPFPTSFIVTGNGSVTRGPDRFLIPTSTWFNNTTSSWNAYFDGGRESTQGYYGRVISFAGSGTFLSTDCGNTTKIGTWNGTSNVCKDTGIDYYTMSGGAAAAYDEGMMTRSITGRGLPPVDGSYTGSYSTTGNIGIGGNSGSATNMLNGHIQKLKYYPARVLDAQLQLLTQ
ncbi:MAG: hypothetical protein AUJ12_02555 [Alphaproteobacteria bacterium CG1_02_46_17]|nr:MAG: hypothetical protein AUJ12_02555 [Alphaproteobacteria bacterium CG1_02_46_17]